MTAPSDAAQLAGPSRRGWVATVAVLTLVIVSLWYGHAPPRSVAAYDKQAGHTVAFLDSQLRTGILWSRQHQDGNVTEAATVVAFDEGVEDARRTLDRFTGYVPPGARYELRERISTTGSNAVEQLGRMRIAAHRGDWTRLSALANDAEQVSKELRAIADGLPQ